eukprot:scaffold1105_cov54-Phaeocystis_antarctica.AAC.2
MRSRLTGSGPFVPGEKSSASPSWHGLARCGGWHGLARRGSGGGSPARAARRLTAQTKAARPRTAIGGPGSSPACLLRLQMCQTEWAKMMEVSAARVKAARGRAA